MSTFDAMPLSTIPDPPEDFGARIATAAAYPRRLAAIGLLVLLLELSLQGVRANPEGGNPAPIAGQPDASKASKPAEPKPAAQGRIDLSPPRDFGYVMGDVIESEIVATVPKAFTLAEEFLPRAGVLDEWLDVRGSQWERTGLGSKNRYRIRISYQVFKGVRSIERAKVPALPIRFAGPEPLELTAPAWEFTLQPLIAPQTPDEAVKIRAPLPPPVPDGSAQLQRALLLLSAALLWGGFLAWRRWKENLKHQPFRRTQRAVRALLEGFPDEDAFRAAARLMHQAVNESAGHAVFAGQIDVFLQKRPEFAAVRMDLIRFFDVSEHLFFAAPDGPIPPGSPPGWLLELSRRCARLEGNRR